MRDFLILLGIALIVAGGYGYHHNPKECQKLGLDVVADTKAIFVPPVIETPVVATAPAVSVVSPTTPAPQHYAVGFVAQPDAPPSAPAATPAPAMAHQSANLPTFTDYDQALDAARSHHVPLLILFTGSDWCHYCKMLEQEVLSDSGFQKYISDHYVFLTVDDLRNSPVSNDDKQKVQALEQKFSISCFPSLVMVDENEHEKGRVEGYNPGSGPSAVTSQLDQVAPQPGRT